jgi:esterase/lipase
LRYALILFAAIVFYPATADDPPRTGLDACVVLLHGLSRTELSMKWLQWELEEAGFSTANPTYPSLLHPIEETIRGYNNLSKREVRKLGKSAS